MAGCFEHVNETLVSMKVSRISLLAVSFSSSTLLHVLSYVTLYILSYCVARGVGSCINIVFTMFC